jgi:Leucine-rich repeat (LRR) protein
MEELDLHWTSADPDLGIPSEGVLCKDMKDIIARISQVKDTVKKINLNNQSALTEVPKIIGECTLLEELNISHTGIKEVPDFIFTLPNLHFLSCRCMELMYFPADLSKAEKLEKLHFRINNGASFPKEMLSLKNLKRIAVDLYSDAAFPENLGTLKKLEKLNLFIKFNYSEIPRLPDSFKNHPAFKNLNIHDPFRRNYSKFNLSHASNILSSCPSFESLKLSNIDVGNGYLDMALLLGLKELELRQLLIDGNIFDAISHLPNLEMLQILGSSFKITEIPDMFANMKKLREFSFAGNMIKELPPSIYTLGNLTTLEIGSTGISALDEKIANLKNLETLQIYDNVLSRLPDGVFTLPKLKILNVEENIIAKNDLIAINGKIKEHEKNGQKI